MWKDCKWKVVRKMKKTESLHLALPIPLFRNLLRPSGVRLQVATMKVKVFQAEDLPQSELACIWGQIVADQSFFSQPNN